MKRLAIGKSVLLPYLLILTIAVLRVSGGHPYHFIPIFSCLIFFGACRPAREFAIPVLGLIGVDIFLTTHQYGYAVTIGHVPTWLWYLGAVLFGSRTWADSISLPRVLGSSLLAAISFFAVSNFVVWAEWGMYAKSWGGLGTCYVAALPFFRNSMVAETVCSLLLYAAARAVEALAPAARLRRLPS